MIRAHLRRWIGGGLDGPLRSLPQGSVARAKPALEVDHPSVGGAASDRFRPRLLACHVGGFHCRAPALPAQRILGGGVGRGAKPPSEGLRRWRSWTLLLALARVFLRQAPRAMVLES